MISASDLIAYCSSTLDAAQFQDAALNGLQVEGRSTVQRLATSVSVSAQVIQRAVDWKADLLLVHHGLFWGERSRPITGPLRHRLSLLLGHDLGLAAYHLPLDAHPTLGNNALLADRLGLRVVEPLAAVAGRTIGYVASPDGALSLDDLIGRIQSLAARQAVTLQGGPSAITRVGIVSGSGYSALEEAAELGCEVLLTGDVREPSMALAREIGISVIAAGHEATERLGIQALAEAVSHEFDVETTFISDPNPI